MSRLSDMPAWNNMSFDKQADFLEWNGIPLEAVSGGLPSFYSSASEMLNNNNLNHNISTPDLNTKDQKEIPSKLTTSPTKSIFDSIEGRLTRIRDTTTPVRQEKCKMLKVGDILYLSRQIDYTYSSSGIFKIAVTVTPSQDDDIRKDYQPPPPSCLLGYLGFDVSKELADFDMSDFIAVVIKLTGNEPDKPYCGVNISIRRQIKSKQ